MFLLYNLIVTCNYHLTFPRDVMQLHADAIYNIIMCKEGVNDMPPVCG